MRKGSLLTVSPSRMRILNMEPDLLLKNYALIMHKASSLSAMQRKLVEDRVAYLLKQEKIKPEDVSSAVNDLSNFIKEQLQKELGNDSSTD